LAAIRPLPISALGKSAAHAEPADRTTKLTAQILFIALIVSCSVSMAQQNTIEDKLKELGIALPEAPTPVANYVPAVRTGNLLFLSGQGPRLATNQFKTGKVGRDVTTEEAYQDARLVGIQLLAAAKQALDGDLSRVRRVVKLLGLVNGTPEFAAHPQVINGCSDLLVQVFGDAGRHARSAVGANLPQNITVEIEAIFEVF
jgi:enamine deaminase RidA (YjgF/YER057c/UK114 family)